MTARLERAVIYVVLALFTAVVLLPLVNILTIALQEPGSRVTGLSFPTEFHFENFVRAWEVGGFADLMSSSALVAVVVVPVATLLSILSGYAFGTMRFRGSTALFYLFLIGLVMPFEATVVPLYYDLRSLGLTDTYWALILPEIALSVSFGTFWMRAFFLSSPRSLLEAARIDGASSWTALWRVLLPTARPGPHPGSRAAHRPGRARAVRGGAHRRRRRSVRGGAARHPAGDRRLPVHPTPFHPRNAGRIGQRLT
jgi:raffinose/stachyose/melibiose transport system permease protein